MLDNGILDLLSRERLAGAGVPPALLGGTTNIVPIPPPALRSVRVMHGDPAGVAMERACAGGHRTCSVPPPAAHRRHRICPRETPAHASSPSGPKQRFSGRKKLHKAHGLRGGRAAVLLIFLLKLTGQCLAHYSSNSGLCGDSIFSFQSEILEGGEGSARVGISARGHPSPPWREPRLCWLVKCQSWQCVQIPVELQSRVRLPSFGGVPDFKTCQTLTRAWRSRNH